MKPRSQIHQGYLLSSHQGAGGGGGASAIVHITIGQENE